MRLMWVLVCAAFLAGGCADEGSDPELPVAATYSGGATLESNGCELPGWSEGIEFYPDFVVWETESGFALEYGEEFGGFLDALIGSARFDGSISTDGFLDLTSATRGTVAVGDCIYTSEGHARFLFASTTLPGACEQQQEVVARILMGHLTVTLQGPSGCDELTGCESLASTGGTGNDECDTSSPNP